MGKRILVLSYRQQKYGSHWDRCQIRFLQFFRTFLPPEHRAGPEAGRGGAGGRLPPVPARLANQGSSSDATGAL
jgi:hypothetical protein